MNNSIIKKLSEIFNISENEILEKLNLTELSNSKEVAKSLGVYGLFLDKNELESYIKNKVQNKQKEIDLLQNENQTINQQLESLKNINDEFKNYKESLQARIKDNFIKEWGINKLPKTDFADLDLEKVDFLNIKQSVIDYAKNKNLEPQILEPAKIQNENQTQSENYKDLQVNKIGAVRRVL